MVVASAAESIREAAVRLRDGEVGTLVVLDEAGCPIGILTDRDVAVRCVATGRDPATATVGELMSHPPVLVQEATPIEDALERMAGAATRRLVVVGDDGKLVGLLALDDVLELLVEETRSIGKLLRRAAGR